MKILKKFDLVVVGGGISGICASLAAARHGLKTALIQNRPVLGGNASSEIKMHICGADYHASKDNVRETGIIEELLLANKAVNCDNNFSVLDTVLWEKTRFQENLTLFLNTQLVSVNCVDNKIESIYCNQLTTQKDFCFKAPYFVDTTGDGVLGYLSGAKFMVGKEASETFNEDLAPKEYRNVTMGSSLMFKAKKLDHKVEFKKPFWANTYTEDDLIHRDHSNFDFGYWWIELGGDKLNTIDDAEEIRDELLKSVYGIWDHIKNGGDHGADNYVLDWVGFLPGKRESRRFIGDYVLRQEDLIEGKIFEDAVAYGGWPMDIHATGGINNTNKPTNWNFNNLLYTIPYRSLYSQNIKNLFIGGRAISASHVAFSSTRVMATCGVVGQAIGTAAYFCFKDKVNPRDLLKNIKLLQNELLKDDCFIPGYKEKLAIFDNATVKASSQKEGYECSKVINGYQRNIKDAINMWSSSADDKEKTIEITLKDSKHIDEIVIDFNSNLSKEIMITQVPWNQERILNRLPDELVKDYELTLLDANDKEIYRKRVTDNIQRHVVHKVNADWVKNIKVQVFSSYGICEAQIFDIKAY